MRLAERCVNLSTEGLDIEEFVTDDTNNDAPNYTISLGVAKTTRQLQGYTKQKGLDKDKIKQMVLQYLMNAGSDGAKRDGIYEYIKDVMPSNKTEEQKLRSLGDLLKVMKVEELIRTDGRNWFIL